MTLQTAPLATDAAIVLDVAEETSEPVDQATDYTFPSWKTAAAVASIKKANRRAERAGIPERFGYTLRTWEQRTNDPSTGMARIEEMTTLTLDRPVVRHDGWEFTATLTWDDEAGLVTRTAPGARLDARPTDRRCEVCGQQRDRRDTYVVQRTDPAAGGRRQMQVGSNCLTRFLGIRPAGLWMLGFEPDETPEQDEPDPSMRVEARFDTQQVLALGLAVVEQHGWVSRSAAQAYAAAGGTKAATADIVEEVLAGNPRTEEARREFETLRERAAHLTASGDAAALLAEAQGIAGDSDYAINLAAVATATSVGRRNVALLLSAIAVRQNRLDQELVRAAQTHSDWVGDGPGAKVADVAVTVESVRYLDSAYGVTTLVSMADEHGNVIKWFASGSKELAEGQRFTLKATVKAHEEYQGVKQTIVTRAKLTEATGDEPA